MLSNYGHIGLFLIVAVLFSLTMILLPWSLRYLHLIPHKPNSVKNAPYECGMETIGKTWIQFNFRYYYYALIFVALDVMVLFLYLWAIGLRQLGTFSLVAIAIFIVIIIVGYIYAWKRKVLEWK